MSDEIPLSKGEFVTPSKAILTPEDLEVWKRSPTHQSIVDFITQLNQSICNKKLTDDIYESEVNSSFQVELIEF